MTRPTTGIRRIDHLEGGGALVCLYGETDLDDVMLAVVQELAAQEDGQEAWVDRTFVPPDFEHPVAPAALIENDVAWIPYREACDLWRKAATWVIDEEYPTDHLFRTVELAEVGWFRKTPCPPQMCGEHGWHWNRADEGSHAAFLGVVLDGVYA